MAAKPAESPRDLLFHSAPKETWLVYRHFKIGENEAMFSGQNINYIKIKDPRGPDGFRLYAHLYVPTTSPKQKDYVMHEIDDKLARSILEEWKKKDWDLFYRDSDEQSEHIRNNSTALPPEEERDVLLGVDMICATHGNSKVQPSSAIRRWAHKTPEGRNCLYCEALHPGVPEAIEIERTVRKPPGLEEKERKEQQLEEERKEFMRQYEEYQKTPACLIEQLAAGRDSSLPFPGAESRLYHYKGGIVTAMSSEEGDFGPYIKVLGTVGGDRFAAHGFIIDEHGAPHEVKKIDAETLKDLRTLPREKLFQNLQLVPLSEEHLPLLKRALPHLFAGAPLPPLPPSGAELPPSGKPPAAGETKPRRRRF